MVKKVAVYIFLIVLFICVDIVFLSTVVQSPPVVRCRSFFALNLSVAIFHILLISSFSVFFIISERKKRLMSHNMMNMISLILEEGTDNGDISKEEGLPRPKKTMKQICYEEALCSLTFWWMVWISMFGIFLIVLISVWLGLTSTTSSKEYGIVKLEGIVSEKGVNVFREKSGMIHIWAHNEHDLFFVQGVACAQERIFQMDLQRRIASLFFSRQKFFFQFQIIFLQCWQSFRDCRN